MKRPLNLNHIAPKYLAVTGVALFGIPLVLATASQLLSRLQLRWDLLIYLSLGSGILLLVVFLILLIAEGIQDRIFDESYQKSRKWKLKISESGYECQFCGSRKLRGNDTQCPVCGKELL